MMYLKLRGSCPENVGDLPPKKTNPHWGATPTPPPSGFDSYIYQSIALDVGYRPFTMITSEIN